MAIPKPEEFGPAVPEGYSAKFGRVLSTEEFGPFAPHLPDTDRADRARRSDLGGWSHGSHGEDGNALHRNDEMPSGPASRSFREARTKDDVDPPPPAAQPNREAQFNAAKAFGVIPWWAQREAFGPPMPLPRAFHEARTKDDVTPLPRQGGGPIPVQIVGGPPTASASPPPAFHDAWLDGDRPGIEERSRRGAAMFRQDHEGTVGGRMMEHEDISPHVDTSGLDAAKAKGDEVHEALAALAAMVVSPSVNSGALDALIAKATQAKALIASLGSGGGGTSGGLGTTYATTAPTGRQGGPR